MGYRAHTVTQKQEYGSTVFCNWEQFTSDFVPAMEEAGYEVVGNENEDFFEIEKEKLQKFVNSLPDNDEQSISPEHTNRELKQILQTAVNETPDDWVSWEWF